MLTIEMTPSGCDLLDGRRPLARDLDLEEALEEAYRRGEREVEVIEPDGYRTRRRVR